jgi:hypothetical protein
VRFLRIPIRPDERHRLESLLLVVTAALVVWT